MNTEISADLLHEKLAKAGLRSTRQREVVYYAIMAKRDHPTADEIFARSKQSMPTISLATVYNCLDTLVQCDLVKQVNLDRESTRYCPNLSEHGHFHDNETGHIYDVPITEQTISELSKLLPEGFDMSSIELNFRGKANQPS